MLSLALLDLCAAPLALGYAIGRIGCQLSGDGDYGKAWDGPWAMAYPDGTEPIDETVHPTPIYETLAMGLVAYLLWRLRDRFQAGVLFAIYLVLAGPERFLVEFLRRNDAVFLGLTQAQLLSLAMIAVGAAGSSPRRGGARSRGRPPRPDPRSDPGDPRHREDQREARDGQADPRPGGVLMGLGKEVGITAPVR